VFTNQQSNFPKVFCKAKFINFALRLMLFALITIFCFASARSELLPIKTYTSADGLIYEGVIKIYQDSHGFVWLTTPVGLSRFDGYQFTNYGIEDGLFNTLMTDMVEDNNGIYWFGTMSGIIYRFDPRISFGRENESPKKFEDFKISDANPYINRIYKTSSGTIYIATAAGLFLLDDSRAGNEKFVPVEIDAPHQNPIVSNLAEDAAGSLWIAYKFGLIRRLPDGTMINYEVLPEIALTGGNGDYRSDLVRSLAIDAANRVWMITENRHLIVFNPEPIGSINTSDKSKRKLRFSSENQFANNLAQGYAYQFTAKETAGDGSFRSIRAAKDGKIWLAAYKKGLVSFDGREFHLYTKENGLSNDVLTTLMEDSFGNLWIGSDWGAMKLSRKGFVTYGLADGLGDERIMDLFEDRNGVIYATSFNWLINRFDGRQFSSVKLNIPAQPEDWLSHKTLLDSQGDWWFGTQKGLYRYSSIEKLEQINQSKPSAVYTTEQGLPTNNIFGVFEDSNQNVWLSFADDKGDYLTRWDRKANSFQNFNKENGIAENCQARHFKEDAAGNLYFGCGEENIVVYRQGSFFSFHSAYLPKGWWISDMFLDSKGRLWVGSPTKGLIKIENLASGNPTEKLYTKADGLSSIHVQFINEDNQGKIYFVTSRGMDVLEPETGKVKQYTLADGLAAAGTGIAIRAQNGNIWLGLSRGISRFTPEVDDAPIAPPVFIGKLRIAGKEESISALGETEISGLTLDSDQRDIQIDFYGLNLTSGDALRYQYKIDGAGEDNWSEASTQRSVNLNLSPGNYKFLVRAVTLEGTMSVAPATVSFKILRPFWQRWWFVLILTLFIVFVIYQLYRYRLKRLVELEKVRTRIATDLHDDIGASLSKIAILSEVVHQRIAPVAAESREINEPLEEIAGTSRELVDSMSDIVWAINPERDHLSDLMQRMRNLAGEMTELADIGLRVNSNGIETIGEMPLGADLRREIYLIFKETVNNLVKHSACEMVEIDFRRENDELVISVKDDGKGFKVSENGNNGNRGGNGLTNMRRRAVNLGGSYEIASEIGEGANAVLRVPLHVRMSVFSLKNLYRKN
jgi:ligand-binding sensor domain-containing protein/two-component sensor histidine kinase